MTTLVAPPPTRQRFKTFADLQERLGGVPEARIRLIPAPGTATLQDVLDVKAKEYRLCELVEGTLVEKAMGYSESTLAGAMIECLRIYNRQHRYGKVTAPDGTHELMPDLVRLPDVAITRWNRLPDQRMPTEAIPPVVPNLAVEILSRSNTVGEMRIKRGEYFGAGVELVWEVDPVRRTVAVYTTVDNPTILTATDTLDGGTVLPGFQLPLAVFFSELDEVP